MPPSPNSPGKKSNAAKRLHKQQPKDSSAKSAKRQQLKKSKLSAKENPQVSYYESDLSKRLGQVVSIFLTIIALGFLAVRLIHPIRDTDIWWHLREGQHFASIWPWQIGTEDLFTYTALGGYWVNHAWFSDLVFFWLWEWGEATALIWFRFVSIFTLVCLVFWHYAKQNLSLIWPAVFFWPVILTIQGRFLIRPHIPSYLLHTIFILVLIYGSGGKEKDRRGLLYTLIPLQLLWTNSHASFILGIAMVVFVFGGDVFEVLLANLFDYKSRVQRTVEDWTHRAIIGVSCLAVTLVNPFFLEAYYVLFETENKALIQANTTEWFSPFHEFFRGTDFFTFYVMWLTIVFSCMILNLGKLRWGYLFTALFIFYLSMQSHRFRVDFTIQTFSTMAVVLAQLRDTKWLQDLRDGAIGGNDAWQIAKWALRSGAVVFCLTLLMTKGMENFQNRRTGEFDPSTIGFGINESLPTNLVQFMEDWNISGNMWNDLMFGGWLLWFSDEPVYIDGRNFNYEVYKDYLDMQRDDPAAPARGEVNFATFTDKYDIDYLISRYPLAPNDGIIRVNQNAVQMPEWVLVYFDDVVIVYVKRVPKFEEVIREMGMIAAHPMFWRPDRMFQNERQVLQAAAELQNLLRRYPNNNKAMEMYRQLVRGYPQVVPPRPSDPLPSFESLTPSPSVQPMPAPGQ